MFRATVYEISRLARCSSPASAGLRVPRTSPLSWPRTSGERARHALRPPSWRCDWQSGEDTDPIPPRGGSCAVDTGVAAREISSATPFVWGPTSRPVCSGVCSGRGAGKSPGVPLEARSVCCCPYAADGAVAAIGQGPPHLGRGLMRKGCTLTCALGRGERRRALGIAVSQMPDATAFDDSGQGDPLGETTAVFLIGQDIRGQRQATPGQHRDQARACLQTRVRVVSFMV